MNRDYYHKAVEPWIHHPFSTGYLPRAEADEALRRLGELRHLIEEYNKWAEDNYPNGYHLGDREFVAFDEKRANWHEDIAIMAAEVVGL